MIISLRIPDQDAALFRKYAELCGMNLSEMIRKTVLQQIEEDYDLEAYRKALKIYKKDQATVALEDIEDDED